MLVKIHNSYRSIVAVCDSNLIGKKFEEGNRVIEIKETFFGGDEKTEPEAIKDMLRAADEDATFNIVGEQAVTAALKAGIIDESGIMRIQDVPIALVLL